MNQNEHFSVIILAAGKGTRMKSAKAKVLHEVFFKPMIHHVLNAVAPLDPNRSVVIIGHQGESVRRALSSHDVVTVEQKEQLGTGHAVQMTKLAIPEDDGLVMILCGDSPLINSTSLQAMFERHTAELSDITVMTTILKNSTGYGRIISDYNNILSIVEEKEASDEQRKIKEINVGIYLVRRNLLFEALENITPDNTQGEFYLTDIVEYSVSRGLAVRKYINQYPEEVLGVNSRVDLEAAHRVLQQKRNVEVMEKGITMYNSGTITVSPFSDVGNDTLLMQNVHILGESVVGESCVIESGAIIKDSTIGNNVRIGANSVIQNCRVESDTAIPPLSALI